MDGDEGEKRRLVALTATRPPGASWAVRWPRAGAAILLVGLAVSTGAQEVERPGCHRLDAATPLLGAWRTESEGTVFREHWRRLENGDYRGEARATASDTGAVLQVEDLRIVLRDGALTFLADPGADGSPVAFVVTACDADGVRFENPSHDFPQVIEYRRAGDALTARVADLRGNGFNLDFARDEDPAGERGSR